MIIGLSHITTDLLTGVFISRSLVLDVNSMVISAKISTTAMLASQSFQRSINTQIRHPLAISTPLRLVLTPKFETPARYWPTSSPSIQICSTQFVPLGHAISYLMTSASNHTRSIYTDLVVTSSLTATHQSRVSSERFWLV